MNWKVFFPEEGKREALAITVVLLLLFGLYSGLTLSQNRWTLHPDDQEVFIFSRVLFETGHLWYQSPRNDEYNTNAFKPSLEDFESGSEGHKRYSRRPPGIYFLLSMGHLFGFQGPFLIVSILGCLAVLFLYLIVRELYGRRAAMISAAFFALSPPVVYWSNMLFSNMPALSLLLGGLYFLVKIIKYGERAHYFLSCVFFVSAVWVRYDYIFFVLLSLIAVIKYRRRLNMRYGSQTLLMALLLGLLIMTANYATTESAFGAPRSTRTSEYAAELLWNYPLRGFAPEVLWRNMSTHIIHIAPLLTFFGALGFLYYLRERGGIFLLVLALIAGFAIFYYGKNYSYWGFGKAWLASSFTRYFLPVFMSLSIFAGIFIDRCIEWLRRRRVVLSLFVFLVLTTYAAQSINTLETAAFGLEHTAEYTFERRALDEFVSALPKNSIIVDSAQGGYYADMLLSKEVFLVEEFLKRNSMAEFQGAIDDLIARGHEIYLMENGQGRDVADLRWVFSNSGYGFSSVHILRFKHLDLTHVYRWKRIESITF